MLLTCRWKEKPERLLLADICCRADIYFHALYLYSIRFARLSFEKGNRRPKVCARRGKADGLLVWLGFDVTASTPATYQRHRL